MLKRRLFVLQTVSRQLYNQNVFVTDYPLSFHIMYTIKGVSQ